MILKAQEQCLADIDAERLHDPVLIRFKKTNPAGKNHWSPANKHATDSSYPRGSGGNLLPLMTVILIFRFPLLTGW